MPIPITARGAMLIKAELTRLKTQDRPAVVKAIAEAREKGDLSENAEYDAAKESQAFIEGRIAELESKSAQFQVIDPTAFAGMEKIVFSATVTIEDVETGVPQRFQIVGNDESDTKNNRISVSSPIARALIGKSVGDTVEVHAPGGMSEYEIMAVEYI
ncbi:MAG: transcription elongation factor GreA [Burkholderiales bacterium]|nr:transcription elongation factor GreA [Burkholderiales bacterium]